MDPLSSPGLIPIGDSPNSPGRSDQTPKRAGSFSFRSIRRKSQTPSPGVSNAFSFEDTDIEKIKLSRKSSSPLTTPGSRSSKAKNSSKAQEKEVISEMKFESGR